MALMHLLPIEVEIPHKLPEVEIPPPSHRSRGLPTNPGNAAGRGRDMLRRSSSGLAENKRNAHTRPLGVTVNGREDGLEVTRSGDDGPFIVLTETKFCILPVPVWARYSPLWTRVKAHAMMLSP